MILKAIGGGVTAAKGYQAAGVKAGIKKSGKDDVAVIYSTVMANAAGVFTTNRAAAAPILVSRAAAEKGRIAAVVVNAGCANACTGARGLADARRTAAIAAGLLHVPADAIMVASTGVIGVNLPMDKLEAGLQKAAAQLSDQGSDQAAQAIMTTDTTLKSTAYEITLGGKTARIGGIAKGSGMIHPNMATMLGFITTDAAVAAPLLKKALAAAVDASFHMVTVDGDTSTNDMVGVLANGLAGNAPVESEGADYETFAAALRQVCVDLAKMVARDGEGATKFLEVKVSGAASFADAKAVAMSIAKSPLVKTAFFGQDPNWGRMICAAGYAGVPFEPEKTSMSLGGVVIFKDGMGLDFDESAVRAVMAEHDIVAHVDLGMGEAAATVWTCDFSYEYVKINGEYHT